jgi:hypothetical protein
MAQIKTNDKKRSLLHVVIEMLEHKCPEVIRFDEEIGDIGAANTGINKKQTNTPSTI